ncbi:hypothetical protein BH11ACT8_BH11ACT8_16060 [soil metagenome]
MRAGSAAVLVLALVVSGCAGDGEEPATSVATSARSTSSTGTVPASPTPTATATRTPDGALTTSALEGTLITAADLPAGFQPGAEEAGSSADAGCLALTVALDRIAVESRARARFVVQDEVGASGVLSKALSDGDVTVLRRGLNRFATALQSCKRVDVTDADGARSRLEVVSDRVRSSDLVERQVNFTASGSVGGAGVRYPYRVAYSVSLVGNTLAVLAGFEVGESATPVVDGLGDVDATFVERLVAAGALG